MPLAPNGDLVVAADGLEEFARLPVPEPRPARAVATGQVAAVRREGHLAREARHRVPHEPLLLVQLKPVCVCASVSVML